MKVLLGCLMCLVLTVAQTFAIPGGPWSTGKGLVGVVGTYAGTFQDIVVGSNNLGIFTLSVPQTGLATGTILIFTGERTFSGPITGLADPNTDVLTATLQGIPVVTSGSTTIETLNLHADGTVHAKIRASKKTTGVSSIRIRGTAHVTTVNQNSTCTTGCNCQMDCKRETDYTVHGFKQSESG
jgi:hypothetical protein